MDGRIFGEEGRLLGKGSDLFYLGAPRGYNEFAIGVTHGWPPMYEQEVAHSRLKCDSNARQLHLEMQPQRTHTTNTTNHRHKFVIEPTCRVEV